MFRYFNPELQEFYVLILHKAGIGPGFLQPGVTELPELFTSHPDHYALFTTLNGSGLVAWLNKLHERAKVIQRSLEELCKTLQEQSKKPIDTWHELFKGTPKKRISYQLTEVMRRYDDLAIATHMTVLVLEHWPLARQ